MDRTILAVMLVGALLAGTSNAVAVGDVGAVGAVVPLELALPLDEVESALPLEAIDEVASEALAPVTQVVEDILECRTAVRMEIDWWGGNVRDTKYDQRSVALPLAVPTGTRTVEVPIYDTVTQVIWEPTGAVRRVAQLPLLGGLLEQVFEPVLEPVTKTTITLVDTREIVQQVFSRADFAVDVDWQVVRIDWTAHHDTVYLTLPAGAAAIAAGDGALVRVCNPDTQILGTLPAPDTSGYDTWSPWPRPATGWYTDILHLEVRLAGADDYQRADFGWGLHAPPGVVVRAAGDSMRNTPVGSEDIDRQERERPASLADAGTEEPPAIQSVGTTVNVSAGTGMVLGTLAAAALALIGAAGRYGWLRIR